MAKGRGRIRMQGAYQDAGAKGRSGRRAGLEAGAKGRSGQGRIRTQGLRAGAGSRAKGEGRRAKGCRGEGMQGRRAKGCRGEGQGANRAHNAKNGHNSPLIDVKKPRYCGALMGYLIADSAIFGTS